MSLPRVFPKWLVLALAAGAALGAAALIYGLWRSRGEQVANLDRLASENRRLEARNSDLSRSLEAARRGGAPVPILPHISGGEEQKPPLDAVEQAKLLIQFREQLAAANKSVEALQGRIQELEYQIEKIAAENKQLADSEADVKARLSAVNRVLDAAQEELRGKEDRLSQLELANRRLREDNRAAEAKQAQIPGLLRELDELNRRREGFLSNILRRYRDVTDQYRAMVARTDRDNSAPAGELGTIQHTISITEEDLRQLASLNAQAVRLQQKIAGK